MIDIIGFIGMLFIIISFFFKKLLYVRIFSIFGEVLSCIYGFMTATYITAILNIILLIINFSYVTYDLIKIKKSKTN